MQTERDKQRARVTNILVTDDEGASAILRDLVVPGSVTNAGGQQTVKVEKLEDSAGDHSIEIKDGKWKFSNDGGVTEEPIGAGGAGIFIACNLDDLEFIAVEQSPSGAGNLTLVGNAPYVPRKMAFYSDSNCSGITISISGLDASGSADTETGITGPNNAVIEATKYWTAITQLAVSGACTNLRAGMSKYPDPLTISADLLARNPIIEISDPPATGTTQGLVGGE